MASTDAQRAEHAPAPIPDDVRAAVEAAIDRKATRVTVMDLRGAGAFTDHVIGASTLNTGYADEYFALTTPLVIDNLSRSHVLLGQTAADMLFCGIRVYFQYP